MQVARAEDVDVILSKTRKTYLPGLVAARRVGVPHVVHVGVLPEATRAGFVERLDTASLQARLRAPHDGYFVVCEAVAGVLRGLGVRNDRIYDIKNAVDTEVFSPDAVSEYPDWLENTVAGAGERFVVGYVGGLQVYKGIRDLMPAIRRSDDDVQIFIAGDGPQRGWLEAELKGRGSFLGSVPYDSMPAVYDAMDALVLPSYTEGLPRVVLEAQAMATPVIASRVGGVPEVVEDGETGFLYEPGDAVGLSDAIDQVASGEDLRRRIGQRGRANVVEKWSWVQLYDRYEKFLKQIVR
ncbi:group 1 glycosyl transferase [Salinarchaeum sp. Harcht-Bsk1]|nr:group 1 glycosyl transferase [Salinarchaeum sp. Harcht-Bsk1]